MIMNIKKLGHDITKIIPVGRREIDAYFKNKTDEKNEITHRVLSHISSSDKQLSDAISHTSRFSNLLNMDFDSLIECYKNEATKNGDFNEKTESLQNIFSTDKSECEIKRHINIIQNELTAIHELDIKKRMEISDEDICKFCNLTKIGVKSQSKELRLSMPSTRTTIDTFRKKYLMNQIGKKNISLLL